MSALHGAAAAAAPQLTAAAPPHFTDQERQLLRLVVAGWTDKEIARIVGRNFHSIKQQIFLLRRRLACGNRVTLAVLAVRNGWV